VGNEVGAEVLPVGEAVVPPPMAENVVSVPQDNSGSNGEGSNDLGSDDGEGSDSDDSEDKGMCMPFRTSPGIMWY
jgi:hypothetical protein